MKKPTRLFMIFFLWFLLIIDYIANFNMLPLVPGKAIFMLKPHQLDFLGSWGFAILMSGIPAVVSLLWSLWLLTKEKKVDLRRNGMAEDAQSR